MNKDITLLGEAYQKIFNENYYNLPEAPGMQGPDYDERDIEIKGEMEHSGDVILNGKTYYFDANIEYINDGYDLKTYPENFHFLLYDEDGNCIFDENTLSRIESKINLTPEDIKDIKQQIIKDFEKKYRNNGRKHLPEPDYDGPDSDEYDY
jgi:hypothetical protein